MFGGQWSPRYPQILRKKNRHIQKVLAKSGEVTPEAAAELIGKELIAPLKLVSEDELEEYLEAGFGVWRASSGTGR